jgi:DNA-directed RNA polymerase specialized sigma24 family protein
MASDGEGSVTRWVSGLKAGDPEAVRQLWQRYFVDLVRLARPRLRDISRAPADEEDVALSAFDSLCRGAGEGRFPRLEDRNDLWRVLVTITARKAANQVRHQTRLKRGGGEVVAEADLAASALAAGGLAQAPAAEPSPEVAALLAEQCRRLFDLLPDEPLRQVAALKLEGYTDREVAARLCCGLSTVERRLRTVRACWAAWG